MVTVGDFVSTDLNFPNDFSMASDKAKTVKIKLGVLKLPFVQTYGLHCSLREPLRDTSPVKNAMYKSPYCVLFVKRHLSEKYQTWFVACLCFASGSYFLSKSRADIGKGCTPLWSSCGRYRFILFSLPMHSIVTCPLLSLQVNYPSSRWLERWLTCILSW